jgi:hypothetical protein
MSLGSEIRDPEKKPIPDPGSRGKKGTGSRIRIRNTVYIKVKKRTQICNQIDADLQHWSALRESYFNAQSDQVRIFISNFSTRR